MAGSLRRFGADGPTGRQADEFLDVVADGSGQELMALLTGNYKRGNERESRNHPRNR